MGGGGSGEYLGEKMVQRQKGYDIILLINFVMRERKNKNGTANKGRKKTLHR